MSENNTNKTKKICPVKRLEESKNETEVTGVKEEQNRELITPVRRIEKSEHGADIKASEEVQKENMINPVERLQQVKSISKEQQKQEDVVIMTPKNTHSNPLRCVFIYDDGELLAIDEKQKVHVICNFEIQIVSEQIHRIEQINAQNECIGLEERITWKIQIFCSNGMFSADLTAEQMQNESKISEVTKARAYIENGGKKWLKKYINHLILANNYTKEILYNRTGWIELDDGRMGYLTDRGIVGRMGLPYRADVKYSFRFDTEKVGSCQMFNEFLGLRQLCEKRMENSVFLMHFAVLSTLTTIFQKAGMPIKFVLASIGTTNSQKTATALIFSRIFDRTEGAIPDLRFDSTAGAIREKMESYGDGILLVDDLLPYDSGRLSTEQLGKSELILRSYGDKTPKKRSSDYAKIYGVSEYNAVRGCCMMTGEELRTNSESSDTRVIKLMFEQGDVNLDLLTFYQNNLLNFPTFLYDFIDFVQTRMDFVIRVIKEEVEKARHEIYKGITIPRFKDVFAIMQAESRIFYAYAIAKGFMNEMQVHMLQEEDLKMIQNVITENEESLRIKNPFAKICSAIHWGVNENKLLVISRDEAQVCHNFYDILVDSSDYYCILPETLQELYRKYCKNRGEVSRYESGTQISAPLKKANALLLKEESGKMRATHKLGSMTTKRFLWIDKRVFGKMRAALNEF